MPISFKYGAEALALLGVAYGLIKWVGRTLRSVVSDTSLEGNRLEAMNAAAPAVAADMLVRQGIVSRKELEAMTPRERQFLIATAGDRLGTKADSTNTPSPVQRGTPPRGTPPRGTPPHGTPARATPARATPAQNAAIAPASSLGPRLHLITPSRPPLGVAVHCPGCGAPLDRDALQRFGETHCGRCKRPVSAHLQKGRLTVIIEETPEEAEYRRRMESH